jgi:hypothetical protein
MKAQLDLTSREAMTLLQVLRNDESDLQMKIASTTHREFRGYLRQTRRIIQSVIAKLQVSLAEGAM